MRGVNSTRALVSWRAPVTGAALADVASARGRPLKDQPQQPSTVRLQFVLHGRARLYSFWLSPSALGESLGFGNGPTIS